MESTYKINGKEFEIAGYEELTDSKGNIKSVPKLNIPFMSDYKWQLEALKSRLEHPELYEAIEDVQATIKRLKKWLNKYVIATADNWYWKNQQNKGCANNLMCGVLPMHHTK